MSFSKICALAIPIFILFTGCGENDNSEKTESVQSVQINEGLDYSSNLNDANSSNTQTDYGLDFESRYKQTNDKYPNKTILVWATDQEIVYEDDVNNYLSSLGKEYVICSVNILSGQMTQNGLMNSYSSKLDEDFANENNYDIIDSGGIYLDLDGFTNPYKRCVDKGYFTCLDEYLNNTEIGTELYNLMPEKYWNSLRIDGKIFGFDGMLTSLPEEKSFLLNIDLMNEMNISADDFNGSYTDITKKLLESCFGTEKKIDIGTLNFPESYASGEMSFITNCIYILNGKAYNFFESDFAKEIFDVVSQGYLNGNVIPTSEKQNVKINELLSGTTSIVCGNFVYDGEIRKKENGLLGIADTLVRVPEYNHRLRQASKALGVSAKSKNKELAFDAIATIMTDKSLNNLICFGPDYTIEDGYVSTEGYYNTFGVENRLLRSPYKGYNTKESGEKLREAYNELKTSELLDYTISLLSQETQIRNVNQVINDSMIEFPSDKYPNGKEYLDDLNKRLYDAGLQEIIDEINHQLEGQV